MPHSRFRVALPEAISGAVRPESWEIKEDISEDFRVVPTKGAW